MAVLYPIGQAKQALLCPHASVIVVRVNEDHSTKVAPESEATAVPRPVTEQKSRAHTSSRLRNTLSTIGILLLAPIIALLLTAFVFQSYQVDGPSMQNTLHNNDRLIVWKLPRTWARITGHQYVPKRGDIIILTESGLANYGDTQDTKQLVKRVIGLPGDHIVIKNSVITVYNNQHPNGFQPDQTLPYGQNGAIPATDNNLDITLSSTQLFVCGDNRRDSLDSRIFGPIETKQVVGKLVARIFPLSKAEKF
jgi:signal peptidase I